MADAAHGKEADQLIRRGAQSISRKEFLLLSGSVPSNTKSGLSTECNDASGSDEDSISTRVGRIEREILREVAVATSAAGPKEVGCGEAVW